MDIDFLLDQKKVANCSVCGVPMPYDLAIIGETSDKIVYVLNSTEDDYIDILELVCRKIPRFSAGYLEEQSESLKRVTEVLLNV